MIASDAFLKSPACPLARYDALEANDGSGEPIYRRLARPRSPASRRLGSGLNSSPPKPRRRILN
jgi:hypothetical protein